MSDDWQAVASADAGPLVFLPKPARWPWQDSNAAGGPVRWVIIDRHEGTERDIARDIQVSLGLGDLGLATNRDALFDALTGFDASAPRIIVFTRGTELWRSPHVIGPTTQVLVEAAIEERARGRFLCTVYVTHPEDRP